MQQKPNRHGDFDALPPDRQEAIMRASVEGFGRFRDEVNPREILDMLIMLGDGYLHQRLSSRDPIDLDAFMNSYRQWTEILRSWAYKPEFLAKESVRPEA